MDVKDRVTELRFVPAAELRAHPENWRRHPAAQQRALTAVLDEVGFAGAVLAREDDDGRLVIIDGHARAEIVGDATVPVLITDLDEDEARTILATYDPIGAMAELDAKMFEELAGKITTANETILELIAHTHTIEETLDEERVNAYTQKVDIPIYEPTGPKPPITDLTDRTKADALIDEISNTDITADIKKFLCDAAERHVEFNYGRIANYYAQAPADIRELIERSALVIIDYDQALERGFVQLTADIDEAFSEEFPDA